MLEIVYSLADQDVETTKSIGIYNFSAQLARHLSEHPRIGRLGVLTNPRVACDLRLSPKAQASQFNYPVRGRLRRMLWDQWGLYRAANASGLEWLLLPKGFCSFMARSQLKVASYVHDIMNEFYRKRFPGFGTPMESFYFSRCLAATLRQSRVIFTNTEFSRSELLGWAQRAGLAAPKVVVAGYGFEPAPAPAAEKTDRVLLFASGLPHKRTDLATQFLARWLERSGFRGVIDCIGIFSPQMPRPEGPAWNWVGRVAPARGRELIGRARAVVYASEYEGFGMPPVEAVLDGTCPVFSDIPPLREVMDAAGCPFSNQSEESFFQAMEKALRTPPETIRTWAQELLRRHNWPAVTETMVRTMASC